MSSTDFSESSSSGSLRTHDSLCVNANPDFPPLILFNVRRSGSACQKRSVSYEGVLFSLLLFLLILLKVLTECQHIYVTVISSLSKREQ
jgi:hypothetical protein